MAGKSSIKCVYSQTSGFPAGLSGKELAYNAREADSIRKIPWRRKWQPTTVLLPGKSHAQRGLVGYSPWDHEELDMT